MGADGDTIIETTTRNLGCSVKAEHSLYGGVVAAERVAEELKNS